MTLLRNSTVSGNTSAAVNVDESAEVYLHKTATVLDNDIPSFTVNLYYYYGTIYPLLLAC